MVQSNKKLKQKLRAAKAELLAASEVKINPTNVEDPNSKSHESFKSLLNSMTQKPRLSKRDKRREKALTLEDGQKEQEEVGAGDMREQMKGKHRKRKRNETEGLEKDNGELKKEKNPMKKKKKKKKKNKGKQRVEDGKVMEGRNVGDGANGEAVAEDTSKSEEREECDDISKKVYVGGIPYYSTEDDIRSYFEGCGTITEVDCMNFPDSGKFRGIAIITFKFT
ncbi:hypothetical protein HAX54_036421 [Datura stramonium]|uniref:RRM domain-containing protein n=1 Tax=Datura stramonium TaxID=4076 RepID=A0ABS8SG92_DATST|nr:hypothetical protein [Datura stramonium]